MGEGLVAFVSAEGGRRTECCNRSLSLLWLVLSHTEAKKGRVSGPLYPSALNMFEDSLGSNQSHWSLLIG